MLPGRFLSLRILPGLRRACSNGTGTWLRTYQTGAQDIEESKVVWALRNAPKLRLPIRADGYVKVADLLRKTPDLSSGKRGPSPEVRPTIPEFLAWVNDSELFTVSREPELHRLGNADYEKHPHWIRLRTAPRIEVDCDQVIKRLSPDTKTKHAIFKATLPQWEKIKKEGLRPLENYEMIVMSAIDDIDQNMWKARSRYSVAHRNQQLSYVYIFVDMKQAMLEGCEFFFTRHYNIVSPGNKKGVIFPKFFKDVINVELSIDTYTRSPYPPYRLEVPLDALGTSGSRTPEP